MGRIKKWRNVPGFVSFEFDHDENGNAFVISGPPDKNNDEWAEILLPLVGNCPPGTLYVNFLSSGYYDPGKFYGPPERCYPPESDDERLFDYATFELAVCNGDNILTHIDDKIGQKIFDAIEGTAIAAAELSDFDRDE